MFDQSKFVLLEETRSSYGIRLLCVSPLAAKCICPRCGAEQYNKKETSFRTVLDIEVKEPVEVHIRQQRLVCKNCQKSFTPDNGVYPQRCNYSNDFRDFVAQQYLKDPTLTYTSLAERYNTSTKYVADAVNECSNRAQKTIIKSVAPCDRLIFSPVKYEDEIRCVVCGADTDDNNLLLDILDAYTAKSVQDFLSAYNGRDILSVVFCAMSPSIVKAIRELQLEGVEVAIDSDSIGRRIWHCQKIDENVNTKTGSVALNKLHAITKTQYNSGDKFVAAVNEWLESLDEELRTPLRPLANEFIDCAEECLNTFAYQKELFEISTVMGIVERFRKQKVLYGIMKNRILLQNPYVAEKLKSTQEGRFMDATGFKHFGIDGYGLNLRMLKQFFSKI